MKLAVVGAGAMGGALAAEASLAGHTVSVLESSTALVSAILERGLIVHVDGGALTPAPVRATTDAQEIGEVDVAVVFVKAQHTQDAARGMRPLLGPDTTVVSLQNGWGNADRISEEVGGDNLVFGVTYNSCSTVGLGEIAHTGRGETFVGPYRAGGDTIRARRVAELLTSIGWRATALEDPRAEIWKKLILNAATLPTAALTGLPAGELAAGDGMRGLVDAVAAEACSVAQHFGLEIEQDERIKRIHEVLTAAGPGKASMLQDAEAHRKTEIEVINAAIVRAADDAGIDAPLNRALTDLVHGMERGWLS